MAAQGAWERAGGRSGGGRSRWPIALLAVLAVPALLVARAAVEPGGTGEIPVETPAAPEPADGSDGHGHTLPVAGGDWEYLGDAMVRSPVVHHAVWTGDELLTFGANGEVAAFDATGRHWVGLPNVPLERSEALAPVWTGTRVLVWGTRTTGPGGRLAVAAYDPRTRRWEARAAGPLPLPASGVAAWTGEEVLLWGALPGGSKIAAAYDPVWDEWSSVPQAPAPAAGAVAGLFTEDRLVVWGERVGFGEAPFAAVYDPGTRRWRQLPAPPLVEPSAAAATWTGEELVLWGRPARQQGEGGPAGDPRPTAAALRLDGSAGAWHPYVPPPSGSARRLDVAAPAAAWTGERVAVLGEVSGGGWLLEPRSGVWQPLPSERFGRRAGPALVWTGRELLAWGGHAPGPSVELVSWRPPEE